MWVIFEARQVRQDEIAVVGIVFRVVRTVPKGEGRKSSLALSNSGLGSFLAFIIIFSKKGLRTEKLWLTTHGYRWFISAL